MRTAFNRSLVRVGSRDVNEAFRIPLLFFPQTSSVEATVEMDDLARVLDGWMTDEITQPSACQPLFRVLFPSVFSAPSPIVVGVVTPHSISNNHMYVTTDALEHSLARP